MAINKTYVEGKTKKRRPFGVWALTLCALLHSVFILFFTGVWNVLKGDMALYSAKEVPVYYAYGFLSILVVVASVLTWGGLEVGRKSFLVVIALYFWGDMIYNFGWGTWIPDSGDVFGWTIYIADFVFPILCIWYFNRPLTKEFYRRVEKDVTDLQNSY